MYENNSNHTKKAVIIQVLNPKLTFYDRTEFLGLAASADYEIIDYITQKTKKIYSNSILSPGKINEIAEQFLNNFQNSQIIQKKKNVEEEKTVILFNNRLKSSQINSLSNILGGIKVIDRDLLILEIFEFSATTNLESKLSIELARLQLEKSQTQQEMSKRFVSERQGRNFMGKGYGANITYKHAQKNKVKSILKKLEQIRKQRSVRRKHRIRNQAYNISMVGYTNAGKSTLLNTLNNSSLKTSNNAFTTVTTTTRRIEDKNNKPLIFTDTVGFVYDIPSEIISAFFSTLEELTYSDLLLFVIDISDPVEKFYMKIQTTFKVLLNIGAVTIPIVYVFNKIDKITSDELTTKKQFVKRILPENSPLLYVSALNKKSALKLIQFLVMVKNKTILISSSENFAEKIIYQDLSNELEYP
jgi:GTP-binding protein HflX